MTNLKNLFIFFLAITLLAACGDNVKNAYSDYEKTEGGLLYKKHVTNADARKAAEGDILTMNLLYKTESDSVLFNTSENPTPFRVRVAEPTYKGDLMEGFALLAEGDSATFVARADSFFANTGQPVPDFIDSTSNIIFEVKVLEIQTMEEYQQAQMEAAQQKQGAETQAITDYLTGNNITATPTESGLYYIETEKGTGPEAEPGDVVTVHYKGTLLDGRTFDSSFDRGEPISFPLGEGRVIRGWEEGIDMMSKGGKATLIVPSSLAYGPQAPPGSIIEPFSPLVFEVELVDVQKK